MERKEVNTKEAPGGYFAKKTKSIYVLLTTISTMFVP